MKVSQHVWNNNSWIPPLSEKKSADWVLLFGQLDDQTQLQKIQSVFPNALLTGCSTAGEIIEECVNENTVTLTAINFEKGTSIRGHCVEIASSSDSYSAGKEVGETLNSDDLVHIFILSKGLEINGSELVDGVSSVVPDKVLITGGLSGDNGAFKKTTQYYKNTMNSCNIVAVGLYGENIQVGHGSVGGWSPFGPDRLVTKSKGNILYELDGKPALSLYKEYLSEYAKDLPTSGLRFPLCISGNGVKGTELVRTILGVDEETNSLIFAGDIPQGCQARLMMANNENLIEGAKNAAQSCLSTINQQPVELAILISCVGRKLVLKQRVEEEVEIVREVFGDQSFITGFYSYGEICPMLPHQGSLHNQTMTITTLSEK